MKLYSDIGAAVNATPFPIRDNVQLPPSTVGRYADPKYPFHLLHIGQGFFVPNAAKGFRATAWQRCEKLGIKCTTRMVSENGEKGVLVKRIA